jgi:hypothetical protein
MPKHVVTPNTFHKRGKKFSASQGYLKWVEKLQGEKRLSILNLLKRIETGQRRIASFKNFSPREIARRQALFINRQATYLTDAYIDGNIGVDKFQSMHPKTKSDFWAKSFSAVMDKLILPKVKTPYLKNILEQMDLYFALPENIHRRRGSKTIWPKLKRIRNEIIKSGVSPKENLLSEMDSILLKRKPGENYKVKAMNVCIAASIYADIMKKIEGKRWTSSYREAMEFVYPKIAVDEKLVDAIIALSKANPQK